MNHIRRIWFRIWRRVLSRPVAMLFSYSGVRFGASPCLVGLPVITGPVQFGDHCTLVSHRLGNPIGLFRPCIIEAVTHSGAAGRIRVGDRFSASGLCMSALTSITIGDDVMVGANATIIDHDFHGLAADTRSELGQVQSRPVIIEDKVWIGTNALILKGVRIGQGAVIGANCVVSSDVPARATIVGNPGKIISRGAPQDVEQKERH